ncbi:MAG: metal ABC transporter permease [Ilumatobacteraceae bacterium]|nr:metal ABC transporter permease [Ilumatobacteraceae bacterium]
MTASVLTGFVLFEPLEFEFFQRGLFVATAASALCGLIGVFVVLRSMSYIGHGLSHAVFGGAAASSVLGVSYFLGAGVWAVLAALLIGRVSTRSPINADAAIGVVTTASFAVGLAIQSRNGSVSSTLDTVLFGNVLAVFQRDVIAVLVVGVAVTAFVIGFRRELTFATFDPDVARTAGIPVARIDALLMVALSATVIVSARVIGALLIAAMLVLPAGTARLLTKSIGRMLWLAPLLGAVFGFGGMYLSWYAEVPSGAMITLFGTAGFGAAYLGVDAARRRSVRGLDDHAALI